MRIIAGKWRGRRLLSPKGLKTRPTSDRLRERLFSILTHKIGSFEGKRVLDLYAGTGALGIEALSRGAAQAFFVDISNACLNNIEQFLNELNVPALAKTLRADASQLPEADIAYDLIFIDPPYGQDLIPRTLECLREKHYVNCASVIVCETGKEEILPHSDNFELVDERTQGRSKISLLRTNTH